MSRSNGVTAQRPTSKSKEVRFHQLANALEEVFFVMDAELTETLYISPAYETIWARTCDSLYRDPRSFIEGVPDADRPMVDECIARVRRGEGPCTVECRLLRPDGETRWVIFKVAPIRDEDGAVYRISGVALDITERRRTEERLRETEQRFRVLCETSFDAIVVSVDGLVRDANQGCARMFGYEFEDVLGRSLLDFVADESLENVRARVLNGIEGTYEFSGKRKDGTKILLQATASRHTMDGRLARVTALRDIGRTRSLEDQFRQAQKMEAVGRLAGGVAHDFNNLLTVITTASELLLWDILPHDPRYEDVEGIRKAAEAAAALTRQLLAFSRQQVIQPRLIALEDVVANAGKMLRRVIGEDVQLATRLSTTPLNVMIDPGQVEQVIMNLAVNARDAMPFGGTLTIETFQAKSDDLAELATWDGSPFAALALTDTGTGMDADTRAHIFEPFFTTKELGKGTGLGLATVYGIVEQSGGCIVVDSELGRGSTFSIYLPMVNSAITTQVQESEGGPPGGSETIFVVEDCPAVRSAVRQALERYGYTVIDAVNGKAALSFAATSSVNFDLLVTDIVMPEMNGRELVRHLKLQRPDLRVLFMSGYTDNDILPRGVLEHDMTYLQKPFSPENLARKVRELLDPGPAPICA